MAEKDAYEFTWDAIVPLSEEKGTIYTRWDRGLAIVLFVKDDVVQKSYISDMKPVEKGESQCPTMMKSVEGMSLQDADGYLATMLGLQEV